jgi:hypothetical protein
MQNVYVEKVASARADDWSAGVEDRVYGSA